MLTNKEKEKFREETHDNLIKFLKDMFRENSYVVEGDKNKWRVIVRIAGDDKSGDINKKEILKIIHEALKTQIKNNKSRNKSYSNSIANKLKNITCSYDSSDGKVSVFHESIPESTIAKYKVNIIVRGESDGLKPNEQECLGALFSTYRVRNGPISIRNNAEHKKFLNKLLEYHKTYPTWFGSITEDKIISFMKEVEPYKDETEFIARHEWFKSFVLTAEAIFKIMGSASSDMVFVHVHENNEITKKIAQVYKKCNDHCKVFGDINKWCPADIYGVNIRKYKDVMKQLEALDPKTSSSLNALNLILLRAINKKILIPVSLKKVADRTTRLTSMPNISRVNFNGKFDYQIKFNGLARNTKDSFETASGSAVNLSFSQIYKNSLVKHTTLSFFVKNNTTLTTEIQGDYARHGSTSVRQIEKIANQYSTKKSFDDRNYNLDTGNKFNIKTFKDPQFETLISGEFKPHQSSNGANGTLNPQAEPVKNTLESYNHFYDNYKFLSSNQVELAAGVKDKKTLYNDIVPDSNKHGKNTKDDSTFTNKYFYPKYRAAAVVAHVLENSFGGKLPTPMSSPLIENNTKFDKSVNDAFGQLYLYAASMTPHSAPHYKIY